MKKGIILSTLNARYTHASLGLRYLYANLGDLQALSQVMEFTISMRPIDIAEQLLAEKPLIIGFGIYIWNVIETTSLIEIIKSVSPETVIVLVALKLAMKLTNNLSQHWLTTSLQVLAK